MARTPRLPSRKRVYATANGLLAAARECGHGDSEFRQVSAAKAAGVLARVRASLAPDAARRQATGPLRRHLRGAIAMPPAARPRGPSYLLALGPPDTPVFLLAEDWGGAKQGEPLWVFEATLAAAVAAIENHHPLEFYLVARSFEWLVAEDDHEVLVAAGDRAAETLARLTP